MDAPQAVHHFSTTIRGARPGITCPSLSDTAAVPDAGRAWPGRDLHRAARFVTCGNAHPSRLCAINPPACASRRGNESCEARNRVLAGGRFESAPGHAPPPRPSSSRGSLRQEQHCTAPGQPPTTTALIGFHDSRALHIRALDPTTRRTQPTPALSHCRGVCKTPHCRDQQRSRSSGQQPLPPAPSLGARPLPPQTSPSPADPPRPIEMRGNGTVPHPHSRIHPRTGNMTTQPYRQQQKDRSCSSPRQQAQLNRQHTHPIRSPGASHRHRRGHVRPQ